MLEIKVINRTFDSIEVEHLHHQKLVRYTVIKRFGCKSVKCYVSPEKGLELIRFWNLKQVDSGFGPNYSYEVFR